MQDTVISAPSFELNHQPTFLQREAGGQYRFSPPIVPAGTEPDLQALNNSFVAAAKKAHALPDSHSSLSQTRATALNISQPQVPVTTHSIQDPILSGTNSSAVLPDVNFYQNLDPALQLPVPQSIESEQSDTSKDDSSGLDESSGDEQIGWGEVHGRHSTHPGKSLPIYVQVELKSDRFSERMLTTSTSGGHRSPNRFRISALS